MELSVAGPESRDRAENFGAGFRSGGDGSNEHKIPSE